MTMGIAARTDAKEHRQARLRDVNECDLERLALVIQHLPPNPWLGRHHPSVATHH